MNRPLTLIAMALLTLGAAACGESHHHTHTSVSSSHHNHYKPGDGGIDLQHGEVVIRAGGTDDDARVAVDGSLTLDGKPVEISPEGRAALKQYNAEAVAIEQHGVALGIAGAKFGWKTVREVIGGLFDGTADEAGKRAEEGADQLVASARELCTRLDSMYQAQETAAAAVPEFKPYAVIALHQVHDCYDDSDEDRKSDHDDDSGSDDPAAKGRRRHNRARLDPASFRLV